MPAKRNSSSPHRKELQDITMEKTSLTFVAAFGNYETAQEAKRRIETLKQQEKRLLSQTA